ncbi:hypothetical protein LAZ67_14002708, partial [Cordylochernes scorpioides]
MVESSLPEQVLQIWQRRPEAGYQSGDNAGVPGCSQRLGNLLKFIKEEIRGAERLEFVRAGFGRAEKMPEKEIQRRTTTTAAHLLNQGDGESCVFCDMTGHRSRNCGRAKRMTLEQRKQRATGAKVCFRCLGRGHMARECRSECKCFTCKGRHVELMCSRRRGEVHEKKADARENNREAPSTSMANQTCSSEVLLMIASARVASPRGQRIVRILFDSGSQRSYIRGALIGQLNLEKIGQGQIQKALFGGGMTGIEKHGIYRIQLENIRKGKKISIDVLGEKTICGRTTSIPMGQWVEELISHHVELNSEDFQNKEIDILIGSDYFGGRRFHGNFYTILMTEAKMELNQWAITGVFTQADSDVSVLGLLWDNMEDMLKCNVTRPFQVPNSLTKRTVLSCIQRFFDPLVFLSPVLISPKVLLQKTWNLKLEWDAQLPTDIEKEFRSWLYEIASLDQVVIPRCLYLDSEGDVQLHVFCDASCEAYASVVFTRSVVQDTVRVVLLWAKARVAPLKKISIPRLELMACVLGARLLNAIRNALGVDYPTYMWSDSSTAITWITRAQTWNTFVKNRVTEIRNITDVKSWAHISGDENPADLPSRGCSAVRYLKTEWWKGPHWLYEDQKRIDWPMAKIEELIPGRDGKIRVARVKTKRGVLMRPIQKIYPLEVTSEEDIALCAHTKRVGIVRIPLDPVWISWNKVRPRLTRAISPKPWSLGGRLSVCQKHGREPLRMFSHVTQRSVTLAARVSQLLFGSLYRWTLKHGGSDSWIKYEPVYCKISIFAYLGRYFNMAQIQPPETFDFSTPNEWPKWKKRFERYLVVSGMKKKVEADKIDLFMYLMGDRADDIFRTFKFEKEEEATKLDSVLKAFDSHFCVRKNIIYERAKFNSRIQEDREPVDEFITSLYKLADSCEFEGLHEQLIRDRIVVGVRDKALSERMQLDSELTLEKAVKMVRQQEAVRQQQVDLQRPSASQKVNQVKFNSKNFSPKQQQQPSRKKEKSAKTRSRCPKCGGFTHREGQACRAEGQRCNLCSKTGHFANCCPDKQAKTAEVKAVSELDEEIDFLLEVSAVEDSSNLDDDEGECRRRWTAEIQVNGKRVKFKLDSQADVTCVPLCLFKKIMGQQRLVKSDINLRAAEFSELQTVGMFISTLRNGNYEIKEKIYVIRRLSEPLLSRRACELLNLARRIEVVATRINPIKEFPEVFEGLGQIGNPYEIKLKPGAKPYAVHTPRRVPIPLMEKLKTRLDIPGKELLDADALSRQPLLTAERAQQEDTTLKAVVNYLEQGWPDKKKMSQALLSYWHVKDELGVQNGLLMRSCRLVIPASMKLEILEKLHAGHFGITKTRLRARETVWWPGISEEIAETVRKCSVCIQEAVSKHEPLIPTNFPTRPWQKIGMDLFKFENKWYLIVIDYYSRFPEMIQLDRLTASVVVRSCKSIFARHGIPETVVSDNGTQFGAAREFANFARQYGFTHVTSSPRFPQSNGMAEAGVKIAKLILKKNQDPSLGLLEYRSTPLENGYSPAELLMGRKLRTTLPIAPENLNPNSLSGDAASIIKGFSLTPDTFDKAWLALNERYHCIRDLAYKYCNNILNVKYIKVTNSRNIIELIDTVKLNLRNLELLGINEEQLGNMLLTTFILKKIDRNMNKDFELSLKENTFPTLQDLLTFLEKHRKGLDHINGKIYRKEDNVRKTFKTYQVNTNIIKCIYCNSSHKLGTCQEFAKLSLDNRIKFVRSKNLCINCLGVNHYANHCKITATCKVCNKKHHTTLHHYNYQRRQGPISTTEHQANTSEEQNQHETVNHTVLSNNTSILETNIYLSTALMKVFNSNNDKLMCRALIDSGAQKSLITKKLADKLNIAQEHTKVKIAGFNSTMQSQVNKIIKIKLSSIYDHFKFETKALIVKDLSNKIPNFYTHNPVWPHLNNLKLADPEFYIPRPIDIIIGADLYLDLIEPGLINVPRDAPSAMNSKLGWIISGRSNMPNNATSTSIQQIYVNHSSAKLDDIVKKFWDTESIPSHKEELNTEELECENIFRTTTFRDEKGRYVVSLPFRLNHNKMNYQLGDSKSQALRRFLSLERRFHQNPVYSQHVREFMQEYLNLGHMKVINEIEPEHPSHQVYYMPYHAVLRDQSTTTKLRVVFDASAKTSTGLSLHDLLYCGHKLQEDIFNILIKFRTYSIALTADIEKMYRQIRLNPADCCFKGILWRASPNEPIKEYQLVTVTYGTTSAPYLSIKALKTLAHDEQDQFPQATNLHLDLVSDLSTGSFIAALRRFTSRRGTPSDIYSVNGTNFKGAAKFLNEQYALLHASEIQDYITYSEINWHFMPPHAPHFGGIWESNIKSVKMILKKVIGSSLLTFEELTTFLTQIEATLNQRPLTPLSEDPNDLEALTPAHFLSGPSTSNLPETDNQQANSSINLSSRWKHIQELKKLFILRWKKEYVLNLQKRGKWKSAKPNVKIGDLVLIMEQSIIYPSWILGKVSKTFHAPDMLVRTVELRTGKGLLRRPVNKVAVLPVQSDLTLTTGPAR